MNKFFEKSRRVAFFLLISIITAFVPRCDAEASVPYDSYSYDYREYIHFTPAPYVPSENIATKGMLYNGEDIGNLSSPQDICEAPDGSIYICDTNNNRIVVMDNSMKKITNIIDGFVNDGVEDTFKQPYGVCVSENNRIYVADSQNRRVVVLEADGSFKQIISDPKSESLEDGFVFTPMKITVDYADRVYVIAQNMFEGIMVFEPDGNFTGFFGTIEVPIGVWEKFWKRIATKEERSKQRLFIPTEFTGLDIDAEGFVYATNIDDSGVQGVRRLNPGGQDVIRKGANQNLGGDLWIDGASEYSGPSQFTDVVYRDNGVYSCLDRKRGRIFTYDQEGNLLYIFGCLGTQSGTFKLPVAIEDIGGRLVVLDATKGQIICFEETEYGSLINEAVALRYDGDETEAVALWNRVLELDENNELANVGIGKAYLTAGDFKNAMKYLKLGMSRDYYSIAFRRYRSVFLNKYAGFGLTAVVVLIALNKILKAVKKKKKGELTDE